MALQICKPVPGYDFSIPCYFHTDTFLESLKYVPQPNDVFIVTYPKAGTTWSQHLVHLIYNRGTPITSGEELYDSSPFLEMLGTEVVYQRNKPGSIKTHLPFDLIPFNSDAKYLCVVRNPKDTCVSFYHHHKSFPGYNFAEGNFDTFFEEFIHGRVEFGDYFDHLVSWYKHKDDSNVCFLTYEFMKTQPEQAVLQIARFLGQEYETAMRDDTDYMKNVLRFSKFDYMKEHTNDYVGKFMFKSLASEDESKMNAGILHYKKSVQQNEGGKTESKFAFVRKGQVGDWRNHFSVEQSKRMEDMFDSKTKGTGIADLWKDVPWRD